MSDAVLHTLADVARAFDDAGVPHLVQADAHQLHLQIQQETEDGAFQTRGILVWPPQVALATVLLPLPFQIPEDRVTAVAEAAVRLNHRLVMPGFGLDASIRRAYFRVVHPRVREGGLAFGDLDRLITSSVGTAARYGPVLAAVAAGTLDADDVDATVREA